MGRVRAKYSNKIFIVSPLARSDNDSEKCLSLKESGARAWNASADINLGQSMNPPGTGQRVPGFPTHRPAPSEAWERQSGGQGGRPRPVNISSPSTERALPRGGPKTRTGLDERWPIDLGQGSDFFCGLLPTLPSVFLLDYAILKKMHPIYNPHTLYIGCIFLILVLKMIFSIYNMHVFSKLHINQF